VRLRAGWGVFIGFMLAARYKLILAGVMIFYYIKGAFQPESLIKKCDIKGDKMTKNILRSLLGIPLVLFFIFNPSILRAEEIEPELFEGLHIRTIGPAVMSGRVVDLAVVEKDPVVFYVASATGGMWKTENNGVTFKPVFQNQAVHSIGAAAVHQKAPSIRRMKTPSISRASPWPFRTTPEKPGNTWV